MIDDIITCPLSRHNHNDIDIIAHKTNPINDITTLT